MVVFDSISVLHEQYNTNVMDTNVKIFTKYFLHHKSCLTLFMKGETKLTEVQFQYNLSTSHKIEFNMLQVCLTPFINKLLVKVWIPLHYINLQ